MKDGVTDATRDRARLLEGDDDELLPIQSTIDCGRVGYDSVRIKSPKTSMLPESLRT